jgi:hypothetical protein
VSFSRRFRREGTNRGWDRRSGTIRAPRDPARPGLTALENQNDGGHDAPLSSRDTRVLIGWGIGLLVFAVVVAAITTYVF